MDIFNELLWPQFKKLPQVHKLPINEQVKKYNQYLYELSEARHNFLTYQNKGPKSSTPTVPLAVDRFLLQEDLFDILQEDGNKIKIT